MTLAGIVARLAGQVAALGLVGGAAEFANALDALTTTPAAFVIPARDGDAAPSPFMDTLTQQDVPSEFQVAIAVKNLSDADGAAATESLEPIRVAIRGALLGWQPDAAYLPCEYVSGRLEAFDNGVLWWTETYRTGYQIRSV